MAVYSISQCGYCGLTIEGPGEETIFRIKAHERFEEEKEEEEERRKELEG